MSRRKSIQTEYIIASIIMEHNGSIQNKQVAVARTATSWNVNSPL